MEIIAVAIQKGGTGKTATAAALAQAAVYKGLHALTVDMDPQGNCSFALGADTNKPGALELLSGAPAAGLIQSIGSGPDVIPSSWALSTVASSRGSARRLQRALAPISGNYDIIIVDTPPTAGELQYNALQAATKLVIPLLADIYNVQGLYQILDTARQIQQSNPALVISGIVITQYDGRPLVSRQLRDKLINAAEKEGVPYLGTVRKGIAISEAAALQQSLYGYAKKSNPAQDYLEIFEKLTNH